MRAVFLGPALVADATTSVLHVRWPDFEVHRTDDPDEALILAEERHPDLVFLFTPFVPPEKASYVQKIRRAAGAVVALAPATLEEEMLELFEAGVGLYLPADAGPAELVAQILAAPRHVQSGNGPGESVIRCGRVTIEPERYETFVDGQDLHLTPTEFKLLCRLAADQDRLVTHEALQKLLWGSSEKLYSEALRKNILRLRRKLAGAPACGVRIVSVPRLGYKLVNGKASDAAALGQRKA